MPTPAARLRCVGRVDFDQNPTSFFRFAGELIKEHRPCRVTNAFGETMIVHHAIHMEVFNADKTILVHDPSAILVREVLPSPRDPFMHTSNGESVLLPLTAPISQFGVLALNFSQSLLLFAEETRIVDLLPVGKSGEGLEANVNANFFGAIRHSFRFTLTREAHIPFRGPGTRDRTGLDYTTNGAMIDHLDTANFGETDTVIMGDGEAALRVGDRVIAAMTLKSGIARFFTGLDPSKKGFQSKINANRHVLQDLRMHGVEGGTRLFQYRKGLLLLIERETLARLLIRDFALFKQMIIEPATLFKRGLKRLQLFLRRIDPILKGFTHGSIVYVNWSIVNRGGEPRASPSKTRKANSSPG